MKIDPADIVTVCVTPCTSKKAEIARPERNAAGRYWKKPEIRDTDYCITTRNWRNGSKTPKSTSSLKDSDYDPIFGQSSGGGTISATAAASWKRPCGRWSI